MKTIKEEKHKEYVHNSGRKSLSLEINKIIQNSKQWNYFQDINIDKNQPKEINNQSHWLLDTCVIVADSMINGSCKKRLSKKHGNVKAFYFSGARIEDINHYIIPIIKKQPDYLIPHVGTNNVASLVTNASKNIADNLLMLKSNISKQLPICRIVLSKPIIGIHWKQ